MKFTYSDNSFSAESCRCLYTKNDGYNILTIGKRSYVVEADIYIYKSRPSGHILIGNYSSISHDVEFLLYANHDYKAVSTYPWYVITGEDRPKNINERGQIIIGNDVWIGRGCKIIGGVLIGNGAVIGAGAVVNRSIPPYAIVCGNRAEIVGYRFTPDRIAKLNRIKWWYWDEKEILAKNELFLDIDSFLADAYVEEAKENEQLESLKKRFSFIYYLLLDSESKYPLWHKVIKEYLSKFSAADSVLLLIGVKNEAIIGEVKTQLDSLPGTSKPAIAFTIDYGVRAGEIMRYADCFISTREFSSLIYSDYARKTVSALDIPISF